MPDGHRVGLTLEEGKAAHLRHNASLQKHFDLISHLAVAAIRAPALAAVGGIVTALGYYSLDHGRMSGGVNHLEAALFWFLVAVFLTVLAPGLSYLGQYAQTQAMAEQDLDFTNPYVHDNSRSRSFSRLGQFCQIAVLVSVLASYAALVLGAVMFLRLMS